MSLAHHPKLASAFQAMSHIVMFQTAVAERDREIAIIRTGALTRSAYEWGMHVSIFGEKCGLTPEQVEDVTVSKPWSSEERRVGKELVSTFRSGGSPYH